MKSLADPQGILTDGLIEIRRQFSVPAGFAPEVAATAGDAARREPTEHVDRTAMPFVTLDPATSTDLDQALWIEPAGSDLLLHYAIADVGWFVRDGDAVDNEAWKRGTTLYLPDGKAGLYPPALAEGAASLLPDGPRPAIVFTVRVDGAGIAALDGVERALIRSRAKLAYDTVTDEQLPAQFGDLARRVQAAAAARGATNIEPVEQQVERVDGGYALTFRPRLASEANNAAMSLSTNLAVGAALQAAGTGLFRVMDEPDERAVRRLRFEARALGIEWPASQALGEFERSLDGSNPTHAAFLMGVRRAGGGARYVPYVAGNTPWHAAMSATYSHATAPLRRLADRYVVLAALAVANGRAVPDSVAEAFTRLPEVMEKADTIGSRVERAVIDLAEVVMLQGRVGQTFAAVVTDEDDRGARIQLCDVPVIARVTARGVQPGDDVRVRLRAADHVQRTLQFDRVA
jgi:exoribonuclease R